MSDKHSKIKIGKIKAKKIVKANNKTITIIVKNPNPKGDFDCIGRRIKK